MAKPKTSKPTPKSATKSPAGTPTSDQGAIDAQNAPGAPTGDPEGTVEPTTAPKSAVAETNTKPPKKAKAPKEPREELVVFAFRLTAAERDAIHKAAGPAKASRFVRALCVHASRGDAETVRKMAEAVAADAT